MENEQLKFLEDFFEIIICFGGFFTLHPNIFQLVRQNFVIYNIEVPKKYAI